jgi:hypothetical protein
MMGWSNLADIFKEDFEKKNSKRWIPKVEMEGSLQAVRDSACQEWCLILQPATREEKWVNKQDIVGSGALIAFYDADPTFLPMSERKK